MNSFRKAKSLVLTSILIAVGLLPHHAFGRTQAGGPLTYPEIMTALQTKLPNPVFRTKAQLLKFVITQIKLRKVDKPLTKDREDDLRQAGASEELVQVIRSNSPAVKIQPLDPVEAGPVELGDLLGRAIDLIKPEYTPEALRARTVGEVSLALELDEAGRVTSVSRLTVLPNGLTERAIDAARRTRFHPATRDGKPARATGTIRYNFKLNLLDVPATLAAANSFREQRDCDRAIAEYGKILTVDPKHPKALLGRGTCHLIEGNYTLSAADLANAAASDRQDSDVLFFLALALDFKGDPAAAAENYEKALKLRPELDTQATFQCLYIDRRSMTPDQARAAAGNIIGACNQAFRGAAPEISAMLYYKRGIAYRLRGDYERAITDLLNVRNSNPEFVAVNMQLQIAYNSRGLEAFNKKNYRQAFDDVSLAIQADPQSPTPYINRCAIYLYAWKQYNEAITDCTSAIRLNTRSSTAYNYRGYAYERINNRPEAIADYKMALELDPRNETARNNLNRLQPERPSIKY